MGNCIFALITGYLLYEKEFRLSRLVTIWSEVMFYSCFSFLIALLTKTYQWNSIPELVRNFIPITGIRYWYATVYFFVYLVHPFLNKVIQGIGKKEHVALIIILIYFGSFIPTVSGAQTMSSGGCVEIFILMYFVGALIRKYDLFQGNMFRYVFCLIISLLLMCASEVILKKINYGNFTYFVWPMRQLPIVFSAFLMFIAVRNAGWRMGKFIQMCARSTFGVYLIHIGTLQTLIFEKFFDISWFWDKFYFAPMLLIYAIILFAICILIDRIRIRWIEKPFFDLFNKLQQGKGIDLE